jgi:sugar lactone lactonase YvrE
MAHYQLGESPFWHPLEQRLYWVDIVGKAIYRSGMESQTAESWALPSEPGCIAPVQGGGLVMALRCGIYWASDWQGNLQWLATLPYNPERVRANDGKCDARGRLWVGTVDADKQGRAALYCVDCSGLSPRVTCHVTGANTANGLAWSPDNQTLYWADTAQHSVQQWDFDLAGATLFQQREWLRWSAKPTAWEPLQGGYAGRPDGACVNHNGDYFVAMYEGQCIEQYNQAGALLERHSLPVLCPTMPCIGGEAMRTLFVTSARYGRSEEEQERYPDSGAIFYKQISTSGVPVAFFARPSLGAGG